MLALCADPLLPEVIALKCNGSEPALLSTCARARLRSASVRLAQSGCAF